MSVDRTEVDRIARLARLRLGDEEAERLTEEMNRILEHAERLRDSGSSGGDHGTDPARGGPHDEVDGADRAGERRSPTDLGGVRAEAGYPDPLERGPHDIAPAWRDHFFVVPPPPGVTAEDDA